MSLDKPARGQSLSSALAMYFREINRTPLLSAQEERDLARRLRAGDLAAREQMVRANLRLVVSIARRYAGRGCSLEDLIAEGNVGLLKAADRYNPAHNTRFCTYAFYWIRLAIQQTVTTMLRPIRISSHMTALLGKWFRATDQLRNELGRALTDEEVARRLRLSDARLPAVRHALHMYRMEPCSTDADDQRSLVETLVDDRATAPEVSLGEHDHLRRVLQTLAHLPEREATVLRLRFGLEGSEPQTLQAIAARLGVTRERVRQIEAKALVRLREQVQDARSVPEIRPGQQLKVSAS